MTVVIDFKRKLASGLPHSGDKKYYVCNPENFLYISSFVGG